MADSTVEVIKGRLNILDVVSGYVTLKRAGRLYKGLCPFHEEKDPSFTVDSEKQRFKCWGCGAHGDAIDFLAMAEGLDTREAIRRAADLAGVSLNQPLSREERSRLEGEARERRVRRRCRELARRASLKVEQTLPKPRDCEELRLFDVVYAYKEELDEMIERIETPGDLEAYKKGLVRWLEWASEVLRG